MKNDSFLEDIKSRIDIVDFISGYVHLKKSGQNWKGLCPFHSEKTPSFMVSPSKQIFHCFGCGAGGDIIAFVIKNENLSFHEALELMAKKAGISLPSRKGYEKILLKEEGIRNALNDACSFFSARLQEPGPAKEYLQGRGVSDESISLFRLGYAPPGWHNLLRHLRNAGYSDQVIRDAGLAVAGDRGLYDMFRERIIFPITGMGGNVVAFGARAFGDAMPKYLNSPETAVFKKSETLFGLATAKEAIRKEELAIIVEGYMDVIICHHYGFRNVVAPLGTSLTASHIQRLRTLARNAVLVFDGDQAGRNAAKRALPLICRNDFRARVLLLPEKDDPDSYLRRHGADQFREMLAHAGSLVSFILSGAQGEKAQVVREALTLVVEVKDALMADEMLVELSDRTRINETTIRQEFRRLKAGMPENGATRRKTTGSPAYPEEYFLLSAVIHFPERLKKVLAQIDLDSLKDKTVASLFRRFALIEEGGDLSSVLTDADEEERMLVTRFSVVPGFDLDLVDRNIGDCIRKIEQRRLEERISLAHRAGDTALSNELLMEMKKFIKEAGA